MGVVEQTERYQASIKSLLSTYQALETPCSKVELIFDDQRLHYIALRIGWQQHKRIHFCLVHIDICDDRVVIQANNTEDLIDEELVALGIPRDKVCLGLLPPDVRDDIVQQEHEHVSHPEASHPVVK
jgi:hypothetical protein